MKWLLVPYVLGITCCAVFVHPAILVHAAGTAVIVGGFSLSLWLVERKANG